MKDAQVAERPRIGRVYFDERGKQSFAFIVRFGSLVVVKRFDTEAEAKRARKAAKKAVKR